MSALLFGSISSVADTSELQRQSFNEAFAAHGLDWRWEGDDYRSRLAESGGRARIAAYAKQRGQDVDAAAVHGTKSTIFREKLAAGVAPRPGVADTINRAKADGWKVGFVTTTSAENVAAVLAAVTPAVRAEDFEIIVDASSVSAPKPDSAAYDFALRALGEAPADCVAVEDNVGGVRAAVAAGVPCVAFPNENTAQNDFSAAQRRVDTIDLGELRQLVQTDA